jgi:membrane associated rhomboid family serine protease
VIPLKDENPTSRTPVVTFVLLALNVAAFVWQLGIGIDVSAYRGGVIPYEVVTLRDLFDPWDEMGPSLPALVPPPFTILTSMFLHGGLLHLGGNMLFLWVFGNNVEDVLGSARYLLFYLGTGIAAALAQIAVSLGTGDLLTPMVGASGAISGILGAYIVCFPHARVLTLVPIFVFLQFIWIPAKFFIGIWFLFQLLPMLLGGAGTGGGVAYMAHLGGFVAGLLFLRATGGRRRWVRRSAWWG